MFENFSTGNQVLSNFFPSFENQTLFFIKHLKFAHHTMKCHKKLVDERNETEFGGYVFEKIKSIFCLTQAKLFDEHLCPNAKTFCLTSKFHMLDAQCLKFGQVLHTLEPKRLRLLLKQSSLLQFLTKFVLFGID